MKIQSFILHPYELLLTNGQKRFGVLLKITDEKGVGGWGDVAPLPKCSKETLEDSLQQLERRRQDIIRFDWTAHTCLDELAKLELLPSVSFGLESALLSILSPLAEHAIPTSALLMGSPKEILEQASLRYSEGYTSAKLKVNNLNFDEAAHLIHQLKKNFYLRIDVNRAWTTLESLRFFSQFPLDTFDYVEEPFANPNDLALFPHPLAIDESFPKDLSLEWLESLPTLKALIYKPTIQGGLLGCLPLQKWTTQRGISLVLSSSFESDLGLAHVASLAHRLSLSAPVGIGTYHYLTGYLCAIPLRFSRSIVYIPSLIKSRPSKLL